MVEPNYCDYCGVPMQSDAEHEVEHDTYDIDLICNDCFIREYGNKE